MLTFLSQQTARIARFPLPTRFGQDKLPKLPIEDSQRPPENPIIPVDMEDRPPKLPGPGKILPIQPPDKLQPEEKRENKPTLSSVIQDLLSKARQEQLTWTSSGTNLETTMNGYPIRLAEIELSGELKVYKFQVFPKGFLSGFRSPLYDIDAPISEPTGQTLANIYQLALNSVPEMYESDWGRNRGIRLFEIGRSRFTLVFPKNRNDAKKASGSDEVLFLVKKKSPYYGFTELTQKAEGKQPMRSFKPVESEGYIDRTNYVPLQVNGGENGTTQPGMSRERFLEILAKAGVSLQKIIAKGKKLVEESR